MALASPPTRGSCARCGTPARKGYLSGLPSSLRKQASYLSTSLHNPQGSTYRSVKRSGPHRCNSYVLIRLRVQVAKEYLHEWAIFRVANPMADTRAAPGQEPWAFMLKARQGQSQPTEFEQQALLRSCTNMWEVRSTVLCLLFPNACAVVLTCQRQYTTFATHTQYIKNHQYLKILLLLSLA